MYLEKAKTTYNLKQREYITEPNSIHLSTMKIIRQIQLAVVTWLTFMENKEPYLSLCNKN
jgi:hypothetical protein